jgi:hypothetical protein
MPNAFSCWSAWAARFGRSKTSEAEGKTVKCDICDEDFANSVELEKHKEREHPLGDGDEKLEKPDMMREDVQPAPVIPGKTN